MVGRKKGVCSTPDKGGFLEESEGWKQEQAGGYREALGSFAFNIHLSKQPVSVLFHFSRGGADGGAQALLNSHAQKRNDRLPHLEAPDTGSGQLHVSVMA